MPDFVADSFYDGVIAVSYAEDQIRAYRVTVGMPYEVSTKLAKAMERSGVNVSKLLDEGALKVLRAH